MTAYYNENDAFAVAWLKELISDGLIATGDVDDRSILDVRPADLAGYTQCHFFAGIGGWSHALRLAGWPDDRPVWTGSCPCQPLSSAGQQKGHEDERHIWPTFHALIAVCRPPVVLGEQVASKLGREWLSGVRADLEALGYAVGAADLCAAGVGAPHIRQRLWWVADANGTRQQPSLWGGRCRATSKTRNNTWGRSTAVPCADGKSRRVEPGIQPLAYGVSNRMGTLRGAGNAIVPQVAAVFIEAFEHAETDA